MTSPRWLGMPAGLAVGLVVSALTGVPLVQGAEATDAVASTCQGQPATIVGAPDQMNLAGTPDADVIVTGGARVVSADAGNDLVCVTARTRFVDAGPDDDMVVTASAGATVTVDLGDGADIFSGGARPDNVRPGQGADQVATGDGDDGYAVDFPTESTDDVLDLGPGNDFAVAGPDMGTTLEGGTGRNTLAPTLGFDLEEAHRWVFDNTAEVATSDAGATFAWRNFDAFSFGGFNFAGQRVTFRGSDEAERVSASRDLSLGASGPDLRSVEMGGGADGVHLFGVLGPVAGGAGRDRLVLAGFGDGRSGFPASRIWVHLGLGKMRIEGRGARVPDFEDLEVGGFGAVLLQGSARANTLVVGQACWTMMEGRGGSDRLIARPRGNCGPSWAELFGVPHRVEAFGNGGDDQLKGRKTDDRLIGGPGRDSADGRFGSDYCEAETRDDCELGGNE